MSDKIINLAGKGLEIFSPRLLVRVREILRKDFEPKFELIPYLCDKDKISIDVGAYRGSFTNQMIKYSKKCWAFEPIPKLAMFLKKAFGSLVVVEQVALSSKNGEAKLRIPSNWYAHSSIEEANSLNNSEKIEEIIVPIRRLDDYNLDNVGFIKIDVEGHEQDVLQGAKNILVRNKPSILIEAEERHKPNTVENIQKFLSEMGYKGFFFSKGRLKRIEEFKKEREQNLKDYENVGKEILLGNYVNDFVFLSSEDTLQKIDNFLDAHEKAKK